MGAATPSLAFHRREDVFGTCLLPQTQEQGPGRNVGQEGPSTYSLLPHGRLGCDSLRLPSMEPQGWC